MVVFGRLALNLSGLFRIAKECNPEENLKEGSPPFTAKQIGGDPRCGGFPTPFLLYLNSDYMKISTEVIRDVTKVVLGIISLPL